MSEGRITETVNNNFEYFHKLHSEKKKKYINQLKSINKINNTHIPLKFKILNSNMNLNTKSIAINFINKLEDTDNSSGEYNKLEQWIYALVKIPFGTFSNIPINYITSISNRECNKEGTDNEQGMKIMIDGDR